MAGGQERILRRRIKTVDNMKKITRAMELIAATRVLKAQDRAAQARPYAQEITNVVADLVRAGASRDHPLLQEHPEADTRAVICIASDRGLCGAYNSTMLRMAERAIKAIQADGHRYLLVVTGKKAQSYFRFRGYDIDTAILGVTDNPTYEHAREIADAILARFEAGQLLSTDLFYWRFITAGLQQPVRQQILPVQIEAAGAPAGDESQGPSADLEYEPSPTGILNELLPRYVVSRIFSATLDASASEYAAKQRAMKAATDNAEDLKTTLTRVMNRARQDSITTEIMEIVGGAEALAQDERNEGDLLPDRLVSDDLFRDHLDYLDHAHSPH
jgi:F-type H+-transporting ATPase subunit gamma